MTRMDADDGNNKSAADGRGSKQERRGADDADDGRGQAPSMMRSRADRAYPGTLLHGRFTERILGVFFEVYNELGGGFLESVYGQAMAIALEEAELPFQREPTVAVQFRQRVIGTFRPDFIVARAVIVELKGARALEDTHQAQLLNYLRATGFEVGLLLNFGPIPTYKRLVFANTRKSHGPSR